MTFLAHINYVAVFVVSLVNFSLGALWYSPALFSNQWAALIGKNPEDLRKSAKPYYFIAAFLAMFVMGLCMDYLIRVTQVTSLSGGLKKGLLLWIGFSAASTGIEYIFEGRSIKLFFINSGYFLVTCLISGAVLSIWP